MAGTLAHLAVRTPTPTLSIDSVSVLEEDAGKHDAIFAVTLAPASNRTVTVDYGTADETATEGSDYFTASGTLTFAPGETQKTIAVAVAGDTALEHDESFSVLLGNPNNAVIGDGWGTGTILEDDATSPMPRLSIDDVAVTEGNSGTTTLGFTVSLSTVSDETVTVGYATANGTATTADADYVASSGTLTFAPGVTNRPVSVTVNGDTKQEANETLVVNLSGPVNATISDGQGVGTINNDDAAAYLLTVSTGGSGWGTVTSSPSGIDCGSDCSESYAAGTVVTLTAEPEPSSAFGGWTGGSCDGMNRSCQLTMDTARTATATFTAFPAAGFYTVSPCRVLDSRDPAGAWSGKPLGARQERTQTIVGACDIPATAKAISLNVTAVGATSSGHLRLYPGGTARPNVSTVNFTAGLTRANNAIVVLGSAGDIAIFSGQASGSVHVVIDVNGYFVE